MVGNILLFNKETKEGKIEGVDKKSYYFHIGEWLSCSSIEIGQKVYYDVIENEARNIINNDFSFQKQTICLQIDISIIDLENLEKNY